MPERPAGEFRNRPPWGGWALAAAGLLLVGWLALTAASPPRRPGPATRPPGPSAAGVPVLGGVVGPQTHRYLTGWYAFDPGLATRHGLHAGDDRLGGYTREQITAEIGRLTALDGELSALKTFGFTPAQRVDYERLLLHVQSRRLELETIRRWERDPGYYVALLTEGIAGLMDEPGLLPAARRRALTARLSLTSAVLGAALENVAGTPKPWAELALRNTEGLIAYLATELPAALETAGAVGAATPPAPDSTPTPDPLTVAREAALRDLTSFRDWIRDDVLPGASGGFSLGTDAVARHLVTAEACDASLARLEKLAVDELSNLKVQLESTARALDGTRSSLEACRIYSIDHPTPTRLLDAAARARRDLDDFLSNEAVIARPDTMSVRILPNPAFARYRGPVRASWAGPWEARRATPALYLSLPEAGWDDIREEDFLRAFSRYALPFLLMRYGEPGQITAGVRAAHSLEGRVSRALAARSTVEGWGAYCEHVILESGYGGQDGRLRLFQLRAALLDVTRFLAALRIHTAGMTVEQAADFIQRDGVQDRIVAEREALQAAHDLDGMAAFLGRTQIVKLATDARRVRGPAFRLKDFHEELLSTGGLALRLARQRLLPGDKSPAL